jgi:hypothetical protein
MTHAAAIRRTEARAPGIRAAANAVREGAQAAKHSGAKTLFFPCVFRVVGSLLKSEHCSSAGQRMSTDFWDQWRGALFSPLPKSANKERK